MTADGRWRAAARAAAINVDGKEAAGNGANERAACLMPCGFGISTEQSPR